MGVTLWSLMRLFPSLMISMATLLGQPDLKLREVLHNSMRAGRFGPENQGRFCSSVLSVFVHNVCTYGMRIKTHCILFGAKLYIFKQCHTDRRMEYPFSNLAIFPP